MHFSWKELLALKLTMAHLKSYIVTRTKVFNITGATLFLSIRTVYLSKAVKGCPASPHLFMQDN